MRTEGKIVLYKGAKGKGKTLSMVFEAYGYYRNGWKVFSNLREVKFGEYISTEEILNLNKSSDIVECVLIVDEIQIFFDSRKSTKKENVSFSNFVQQIRKRGIILLSTTQYSNTVDLRLRQHLDYIGLPEYNKKHQICKITYLDLTSIEDNESGGLIPPKTRSLIFDARPVYQLYNTHEVVV